MFSMNVLALDLQKSQASITSKETNSKVNEKTSTVIQDKENNEKLPPKESQLVKQSKSHDSKNLNSKPSKLKKAHKTQALKLKKRASLASEKSEEKNTGDVFINSLGHEVDLPTIVDKPPYALERCDQIVAFSTDFIPDLEDYTQRKPGYFTISAYHFNRFEKNDANLLEQSILFANSRADPTEPAGAQNCLLIDGGQTEKQVIFCGKDEADFKNIKAIFATFADCRAGRIISKAENKPVGPPPTSANPNLPDLVKKCGFDGPLVNPEELMKQQSDKKDDANANKNENGDFWIPGGSKVPGSKDEEEESKK